MLHNDHNWRECVLYIFSKLCVSFTRAGGGFCASSNPNINCWKNRKMAASCLGYMMSKTYAAMMSTRASRSVFTSIARACCMQIKYWALDVPTCPDTRIKGSDWPILVISLASWSTPHDCECMHKNSCVYARRFGDQLTHSHEGNKPQWT